MHQRLSRADLFNVHSYDIVASLRDSLCVIYYVLTTFCITVTYPAPGPQPHLAGYLSFVWATHANVCLLPVRFLPK